MIVPSVAKVRARLAPDGVLRTAINTGNRALVQADGDRLDGLSPTLARRLADELGATFEPVLYDGAGKVFADASSGRWTLAFLAVDPARADQLAFTRPYLWIDTTYAVRVGSDFARCAEIDAPGVSVLVAAGSAYDLHLTKALRSARMIRVDSPPTSIARFLEGEGDAVAGVRATLERHLQGHPKVRILADDIVSVGQAMAVPTALADTVPFLDAFLDRARADGAVS